jgi:hypothetical protein
MSGHKFLLLGIYRVFYKSLKMMVSQKFVTPVNPGSGAGAGSGVQNMCNYWNILDSGLRRNDKK